MEVFHSFFLSTPVFEADVQKNGILYLFVQQLSSLYGVQKLTKVDDMAEVSAIEDTVLHAAYVDKNRPA